MTLPFRQMSAARFDGSVAVTERGVTKTRAVVAREGELKVDGVSVPFAYAHTRVAAALPEEPNVVRVLGSHWQVILELAFDASAEAESLVEALRVDQRGDTQSFDAGRPGLGITTAVFGLIFVPLIAMALALFAGNMWGMALFAVAIVAGAAKSRARDHLVVDERGLTLKSAKKAIAWGEIAGLERVGDTGLRIELKALAPPGESKPDYRSVSDSDGVVRIVPTSCPRDPIDIVGLTPEGREGMYFMLLRRRARALAGTS